MKNIFKRITSSGLAVALCCCIALSVQVISDGYASATVAESYYADITATSGDSLLGQVHDLITSTHTRYTTYDDCKNVSIITRTDKGTAADTVMEFYTQEDIASSWGSGANGTWNREHVWCKSLSNNLWGQAGGGSDLHHIRPSEVQLNAARGNYRFGTAEGGTAAYYKSAVGQNKYIGGYIKGNAFEPLDKVKGDIARIVMYVYTHYNTFGNVHGSTNGNGQNYYFGTLKFTNVISAKTESDAIALLLKWNKADPVDSVEITRNEVVYGIQGNRNPFIDHPEYAEAIWGSGSAESDTESVKAFRKAVAEISGGTIAERFASINYAINAYRKMSDADRLIAVEDIETLRKVIASYNETVNKYNEAADGLDETALKSIGKMINAKECIGV